MGLGPPPTKGEIAHKDVYCALNKAGKIYKIEKYDRGVFARPAGAIKDYLDSFTNKIYSENANADEDPLTTLDNFLNANAGSMEFNEYYIHSYDNYNPGATLFARPDGFKLLTHTVNTTTVSSKTGGKRKTRRVKKSNRKSNRKRRSNTKRHTRKH